ncbi:hypothetical protein O1611_g3689 [Lasiodiplodia mahajangana]|uniref:Uncharacterized protein n=1 Tax=Lasiodiplodia mahajangana TaxID=1108764 RepID=A0ACC2JR37_9PEZI|nr:hypothetical protein O1611_g3689 [Lasiodiplodia mahajangana]
MDKKADSPHVDCRLIAKSGDNTARMKICAVSRDLIEGFARQLKQTYLKTFPVTPDAPPRPNIDDTESDTFSSIPDDLLSVGVSVDEYTGEALQLAKKRNRMRMDDPGSIEARFARSESISCEFRERQNNQFLHEVINQQELHDRIVRLVTMRNLPHQAVEWPELKDLLLCINPMVEDKWVKSRAATPKLISEAYSFHKQKLKTLLQSSETRVHFAFNIWTSPNHMSLMAIVAHFVDRTANMLRKALVALPEVFDHTGETMSQTSLGVLNDCGIVHLLGFVCADNATLNDRALRLLATELQKREDLPKAWDSTLH